MVTANLLLHPVRLRILQAFLGDRELTTGQLAAELADIPSASLYRHVAKLVDASVLAIVSERPARGAVERTYRLAAASALIDKAELAAMSPDEHRAAFLAFIAGLIAVFDSYVARGDIDCERDVVSYRMTGLWLDDAELAQLRGKVDRLFAPYLKLGAAPGRTRRLLGTVVLPATVTENGDETT